jgi:hypothetical protein
MAAQATLVCWCVRRALASTKVKDSGLASMLIREGRQLLLARQVRAAWELRHPELAAHTQSPGV